jgi:anaerobic dimethyl sulfoxide reductase subunit C
MFAEEWPLMMFTLLSQLAIGTYVILLLIRMSIVKSDAHAAYQLTNPGLKATGPIMALALIFSLFHLGTPLGAYRSILNLGSAWLSREILTAGGFFALWILSYLTFKKGKSGSGLGVVTALVGLGAIFSMASIYATSIRPAWTGANTYLAFYGSTFALGSVGAISLVAFSAKGKSIPLQAKGILKTVAIVAGIAIILPLAYLPIYLSSLSAGIPAAQASAELISGNYMFTLILRAVISLAGAVLLFTSLKKNSILPVNQAILALVLIFAGEFIGRYVFYASGISMFMGQNLI